MNNKSTSCGLEIAKRYANTLPSLIKNIAAITLGGSLSKGGIIDDSSDIDMFIYLNAEKLPEISSLLGLPGVQYEKIRLRSYLIEYKIKLDNFDMNIKIFTINYIQSIINTKPNLDQQYLEEVESCASQLIFIDNENFIDIVNKAKEIIKNYSLLLASYAIERYGKGLFWAIFQFFNRGYDTVAMHSLAMAFDSLLCISYFKEGIFPPSIKWRASKRYVESLDKGEEIFSSIEDWTNQFMSDNFESCLSVINRLENIISDDFTHPVWILHEKRWWWSGYNRDF